MADSLPITETPIDFRPGTVGPYTLRAENRLKQGKPGDTITPAEMAEIVGRPIPNMTCPAAGNVRTAIERVKKLGIFWQWQRHQRHWKCLEHHERVSDGNRSRRLEAKRLRRRLIETTTVDTDSLDSSVKLDHQLNQIHFAMGLQSMSTVFRKQLAKTGMVDRLKQPDQVRVIELMKNGS